MKLFTFFLNIIFCIPEIFSQDELPPFLTDSLDTYVSRAMEKEQLPGLALCIVKDGKVAYMKGYGVRETGGNEQVDENTLFMIGSNTKAYSAPWHSFRKKEC
jgi:CubicO group peptidase (beta-lactamase class C family)